MLVFCLFFGQFRTVAMSKRLFLSMLERSGANAYFRSAHFGQMKTLIYHNVLSDSLAFPGSLSPSTFERHLIAIKQDYNPVWFDQSGKISGVGRDRINVALTFDDGFINNYDVVFPLLLKHDVKALSPAMTPSVAGQARTIEQSRLRKHGRCRPRAWPLVRIP
jgi:hypothetical protein